MKFTTLILITALLVKPAVKPPASLNYYGKDVPLKEIFAIFKTQANVVFFYDVELLKISKPMTLELENISIENALNEIFRNQPLTWAMEGRTVTIYKR